LCCDADCRRPRELRQRGAGEGAHRWWRSVVW
jgi:hypothetical protein